MSLSPQAMSWLGLSLWLLSFAMGVGTFLLVKLALGKSSLQRKHVLMLGLLVGLQAAYGSGIFYLLLTAEHRPALQSAEIARRQVSKMTLGGDRL